MSGLKTIAEGFANVVMAGVRPLLTKPARDLSREEAWMLIYYHMTQSELQLLQPMGNGREERAKLSTSIAGVQYLQAQGMNSGRFGSVNARKTPSFLPSPQFAIVLYRLAVRLRSNWGATSLVWGGIGAGSGKNALDCHMTGNCVDFYGANTSRGGWVDVRRDWYYRPVYDKDGKPHSKVSGSDDWWGNDTKTVYRLLITRDAEERDLADATYVNPRARDFFLDVFEFIHDQCTVAAGDIAPSAIRSGATLRQGVTMHPDYPTLMRRPHNDHVHFQLGQAIQKR